MPRKTLTLKWLIVISAAIVLVVLFFGLRPGNFFWKNNVTWLTKQPGVRFGKNAMAFSQPLAGAFTENHLATDSFSLEIALKPASNETENFNFVLAVHDGKDRNQLLLAQWKSSIILMNGDDYDNKRKTKRLTLKSIAASPKRLFLTITTDSRSARIYVNGRLAGARKNFHPTIPRNSPRLLLANSVYGQHSWQGEIYGLAFYGYPLSPTDAEDHYRLWSETGRYSFARKAQSSLVYYCNEATGSRIRDHAGGEHHLHIPDRLKKLKGQLFKQGWDHWNFNTKVIRDLFLNFIGFIPLGLTLAATFARIGGVFSTHSVRFAIASGFALSLGIEIVQAWMPLRTSDIRDLALNTLGTLVGVMIFRLIVFGQPPAPPEFADPEGS